LHFRTGHGATVGNGPTSGQTIVAAASSTTLCAVVAIPLADAEADPGGPPATARPISLSVPGPASKAGHVGT
jgi:hypothetical protein